MNISQAAKITGLSTKQIRDYEKNGLLPKTERTYSGYRIYSQNEINRLKFIFNARNVGFSLAQIAELLSLHDNPHRCSRDVKRITEKHIMELTQKIQELNSMVSVLQGLNSCCKGNDDPQCAILSGLLPQNESLTQ
ncbi:Cu(I)-responsive transcriptional regulator [[Pasteurella] aerogenes]|nr:Cu(I)-responsive transcriptional regulator [[Pasteurella] aerogenes]MDY4594069.1 Cu(I)-responsive transcriptional regulator [[Pasteurella] aerogenes]